ncbi:MAG: hypothetical protein K9W46_07370 [Candidatus Heimdallarchaeum endolithica]|uniref:Uncharacterized protein n=1 Tax=Candidatus Heimdallarchaeum endolithica TaxID=2876572 RepID=A0A9Y1BNP5_9ARCH|nr:MAG: hypothetical protein K9W46_07370 [Candidatus Heimdallarchaeum endolithica]
MATMEKQKDNEFEQINLEKLKEEKKISEDKLKLIEASIKGLKVSEEELKSTKPIVREEARLELTEDTKIRLIKEFEQSLPDWVNKPWMYVTPKKANQVESWLDSWSSVMLDYTKRFVIHIVNVNSLRETYPFSNKKIKKELTIDQIRDIIDFLETKGFALWINDRTKFFEKLLAKILGKPLTKKIRAKIEWKTKEEFAEDLLKWMIETGRVVEVHSLYDLTRYEQPWSSLPSDDLINVCNLLVEKGSARWLNREKTIIAFEATKVF